MAILNGLGGRVAESHLLVLRRAMEMTRADWRSFRPTSQTIGVKSTGGEQMAHKLISAEQQLSAEASKRLGYKVSVYEDGRWTCDPADKNKQMAFGDTAAEAVGNCHRENAK